ncbi:MAG: phosphoadenosine phosphosulfate reductase [Candidatus Omnitrophica bacterium CG1_02_46_14]|nr:MAG: phosphoadenosine phosphosulfate reductase [Candidatus Omnitrophica bacterium CG1_02_46_14]
MLKKGIGRNVFDEANRRIAWIFDRFPRIYVSFSGGKDSTVMLHLVMSEALRRGRKIGVLFLDLEAQYKLTIDHVQACYDFYHDYIDPFWISLPIHLRNAVSMYETHWVCFENGREEDWVRKPPKMAITDQNFFPFFHYAMEFEEFVEQFGHWYGEEELTACFVGIRADESLNRFRTIMGKKSSFENKNWTTYKSKALYNIYPIYDWKTDDIWIYNGKYKMAYNALYDRMYLAGLTVHQMRICQPYGDDQRKGLWLFHVIEPETWGKVVARVNGANSGAIYAQESGNILGNFRITKPDGHTWRSFAELLMETLPPRTKEHFQNKIAVFLHWWMQRGYQNGIPDEANLKEEAMRQIPSWRRICKALLRNDYWCKGLSFSQHKSQAYQRYLKVMKKRRQKWGIWAS